MLELLNGFGGNPGVRLLAGALFFGLLAFLFYRLSRGAGKVIYLAVFIILSSVFFVNPILHLVAFIPLVVLIILNEMRLRKLPRYSPAVAKVEGGGIKRGLTPAEASILLGRPFNETLVLVIFDLLQKGMLEQVDSDLFQALVAKPFRTREQTLNMERRAELRRLASSSINATLHPFEEPFLELFEQADHKPLHEIDFGIVVKPLVDHVASRVEGFDMAETRAYYELIIRRAPKEARVDGYLVSEPQKVFDRNLGWVLLHDDFAAILDQEGYSYAPNWLRDKNGRRGNKLPENQSFAQWAARVMLEMKDAIPESALKIKLGKEIDHVTAQLLAEISQATFYG